VDQNLIRQNKALLRRNNPHLYKEETAGFSDPAFQNIQSRIFHERFAFMFKLTAANRGLLRRLCMSYFPLKEADFVEWSGNPIAVSKENITEWALPADQVTGLETLHNESKALHEKCQTASYTNEETKL
jgi:hypothetical protein